MILLLMTINVSMILLLITMHLEYEGLFFHLPSSFVVGAIQDFWTQPKSRANLNLYWFNNGVQTIKPFILEENIVLEGNVTLDT